MKTPILVALVLLCRPLMAVDAFAAVRVANTYTPPFASGIWFVVQGGDTPNVNHHFQVPEQWYGIDIVRTEQRALTTGDGSRLGDCFSYGQQVVSPCTGTVLAVENARPDNQIGATDAEHEYGNHVIIDAGKNEYVVLAHFKPGSITVAPHDRLVAGQPIGLVGNSGNTTMPHLHMHIQNAPALRHGDGRLFSFTGVIGTIAGTRLENAAVPLLAGMWLQRP